MRKILIMVLIAATMLLATAPAAAQKATEIYIPIGKSPGLSGRYTIIGHIRSVDMPNRTMEIASADRSWTAKLSPDTKIWLDRQPIRKRSIEGSAEDCCAGRRVEVKYQGPPGSQVLTCEWVKIAVDGSS